MKITSGHKAERSKVCHVDRLLRLVSASGRHNQRIYRVSKHLNSHDAKLLATIEADEAMRSNLGAAGLTKAELKAIAGKLDPWKGTEEPVSGYWKKKSSGKGHRFICKFGPENRALQYLVRDVLIAQLELHPNQYATRGGVHAAIKHTKQALSDGYVWAAELDIKDCYPSFDESKLPSLLPLPKEVTERVILSRHLNLSMGFSNVRNSPGDDHKGDATPPVALSTARRGIPQGSAVSPIVAEAMVAIALISVPTLGVIIAYADNILLLAKTKSDRDSMTEALLAAFKAHPVGRLRLSRRRFAPGHPVEFLGHCLTPGAEGVRIEPSNRNLRKFEHRMKSKLRSLTKTKRSRARRKTLHDMTEAIQSWAAEFTLCDDIQKIRTYWLARVHEQFKQGPDSVFDEEETMSNTVYRTFKFHPDQNELLAQALKLVKDKTGTTVDTVALEYIATQFMGTGVAFNDSKAALTADRKLAGDSQTFLQKVMPIIEELVPELLLKLEYAEKE